MARKLVVEIVGDTSSLQRAFKQVDRQSKSFSTRISRSLKVGLFAGASAGVAGLTVALKAGFDEMAEGQKVAAQTAAALKSTGAVAGVSARQIEALAGSLQRQTGADDEAVQSAENLLLTFTNIRNAAGKGNDVFDQTTKAALDLSQAFGQDLNQSAIQLGKALNDPVQGVTALRRVGISFTASQQHLIGRLVETGHVLDAQKVILREVQREVGGSARAYGQTLPGQIDILKGNLQNLAGELAQTLNPQVEKLTTNFNKWLENPEHKRAVIDSFTEGIERMGRAVTVTVGAVEDLKRKWDGLSKFLRSLPGAPPTQQKILAEQLRRAGIPQTTWGNPGALASGTWGLGTMLPAPAGRRGAGPSGADIAAARRGITAAQRNAFFDARISRALDRVQDIPGLRGQIGRLREIAAMVEERMAATRDITRRLTLEDRLLDVQRQLRSDIAEKTQKAADEALAVAEKLKRQEEKQRRAEKAATDAATRRIAARNKAALANARAINELSKKTRNLVKNEAELFRHLDPNRLARMLGLPGDRAAAAVLATIGRGGTAPVRTSAAFAGQTTVINGGVHMHGVQDVRGLEADLAKRARGRSHTRRGAR